MPHERQARPVQRQPLAVVVSVSYVFAGLGSALLALAIDDLDVHGRRLREGGLAASELSGADAPRRLVVTDRDGNTLTFFHDPAE